MNSATSLHTILDKKNWRLEEIKKCLEQDSSSVNVVSPFGPPLHRVLKDWNKAAVETVNLLLNHGADVNSKDIDSSTAMIRVFMEGAKNAKWKKDMLQLLIKKGASLNALDADGRSSVCSALHYGNELNVIELLLEAGCSLNACEKHESPLHCAVDLSDFTRPDGTFIFTLRTDVFEMLLKEVEKASGKFEDPKLLQHVLRDVRFETEAIRLLLDRHRDVGILLDERNNTLLHLACGNPSSKTSVLKLLIKRGVKVNVKNACGQTPLQLAAKRGKVEFLKVLFIAGAQMGCTTGYHLLESFVNQHDLSGQSEKGKHTGLNCFKMLVKCYFLENPFFDFQSLIQDHKGYKELSRFGVDCLSELQKLDSRDLTLRLFLQYSSDQLPAAQYTPDAKSRYFNQLLEKISQNACPLLSDIIIGKVRQLSMEILEVCAVKCLSYWTTRVTLDSDCVGLIVEHLEDDDLLRFISAFKKRDSRSTQASEEQSIQNKKKADSSERCHKRPRLQASNSPEHLPIRPLSTLSPPLVPLSPYLASNSPEYLPDRISFTFSPPLMPLSPCLNPCNFVDGPIRPGREGMRLPTLPPPAILGPPRPFRPFGLMAPPGNLPVVSCGSPAPLTDIAAPPSMSGHIPPENAEMQPSASSMLPSSNDPETSGITSSTDTVPETVSANNNLDPFLGYLTSLLRAFPPEQSFSIQKKVISYVLRRHDSLASAGDLPDVS